MQAGNPVLREGRAEATLPITYRSLPTAYRLLPSGAVL